MLGLVLVLVTGCLSNPARGTKASGEPLRLRFDTQSGSYQAQEVVGQDNYYDSDGNAAGSVERTRAVTKHWSNTDVSFYQGDEKLDEQDYFRIAGNQGAADEVAAARAQMSRDLTIGFPVAIVGAVGSTLAAIGTFGTSPGMRYGVSTGASLVSLTGLYFATRGLKTRNKKTLVEPERAIRHASEVERCYRGRCRTTPGGAPTIKEEVAQLKPIVVPPPARTLVGKWRGTSESVLRQGGRSQKRSTSVQFAVEAGPGGTVFVILEPGDPQACRLEARVDGLRAELVNGQTCIHESPRGSMKMVVREGSALELRGEELQIALEVELVVRERRRSERMTSSMSATATRM